MLRFNRRLLWVGLACVAWAYLVLGAALAQLDPGPGGPDAPRRAGPRAGLHLRMPRGAVMLPGRIVEVREEAGGLHIVMAVRDAEAGGARGPDGEAVRNLPAGTTVDYVTEDTLQLDDRGQLPRPSISTLEGQDRPLRLPNGKEVIVGQQFYLSLTPEGVALIPHHGEGMRLLEGPMRRQGWGEPQGRPADGGRERPGNWLRDFFQGRKEKRGEGRGGEGRGGDGGRGGQDGRGGEGGGGGRGGNGGGGQRPPDGGRPPDGQGRPPHDGEHRPPQDGSRPPEDGGPPPDGQGRPPQDGNRPPDGQGRPPQDGNRPPDDGHRPPPDDGHQPPPDGERKPPPDGERKPPPDGNKPPPGGGGGGGDQRPPDGNKPPPGGGGGGNPPPPPSGGGNGGGGNPPPKPPPGGHG